MILSHSHKFIALKTRKTGGTSFEIALSKYAESQDIITPIAADDEKIRNALGFAGPQNHAVIQADGRPVARFYNHIGANEVQLMLPGDVFNGYTKVAIVRNPFDYVVSWYYWERSRIAETSKADFRCWLLFQHTRRQDIEVDYRRGRRPNPGVFLSNRFITHIDGTCAMDVMLRYEHLDDDMVRFAERVGLPCELADLFADIRAKGHYRPKSATAAAMFDGFLEGVDIVSEAFAEEIEAYQYALG